MRGGGQLAGKRGPMGLQGLGARDEEEWKYWGENRKFRCVGVGQQNVEFILDHVNSRLLRII